MKKISIIALLWVSFSHYSAAQSPFLNDPFFSSPFALNPFARSSQHEAQFEGGDKGLEKYIQKHLRYPRRAKRAHVQGVVHAQFVINEDGSLSDAQVTRSLGYGCDEAALRLLNNMPRWQPALYRNQAVKARYSLPISFTIPATKPAFVGGKNGLDQYVRQHLTYPTEAVIDKIEGTVVLELTITKQGKVKDVSINQSLHPLLDAEAMRLAHQMPTWIPATFDRKKIDKRVLVPIEFHLPKRKITII